MTTESETSPVTHHPAGDGGGGSDAGARARAREGDDSAARREATQRGRRLVRELTPPEPWTHRSPAPAAVYRYARHGGWTGPDGAARRLGVWWARLIGLPIVIATAYLAWLAARPSRAITAAVVLALVWLAWR